ncbi:MAG: hypothetical protein AAF208_02470 [Cyanobacteria bacterium P01_A01_bin.45]
MHSGSLLDRAYASPLGEALRVYAANAMANVLSNENKYTINFV